MHEPRHKRGPFVNGGDFVNSRIKGYAVDGCAQARAKRWLSRRSMLAGAGAALMLLSGQAVAGRSNGSDAGRGNGRDEDLLDMLRLVDEQNEALRKQALDNFPYELVKASGADAFDVWAGLKETGLKNDGQRSAVILGSVDEVVNVFGRMSGMPGIAIQNTSVVDHSAVGHSVSGMSGSGMSVEDAIRLSQDVTLPEGIYQDRLKEREKVCTSLSAALNDPDTPTMSGLGAEDIGRKRNRTEDQTRELMGVLCDDGEPSVSASIGLWPLINRPLPELTVTRHFASSVPYEEVFIALVPTADWIEVPAYLHWGGWHGSPRPHIHVAALRTWREKYNAELVGLSSDTMNLRVGRRPDGFAEALELAHVQSVYCPDLVGRGLGTLAALAVSLLKSDWWFFQWR